ncbi:thiamine phosphate synthase [Solitalea lacus]|uniref:thiamine phosphate synthase n=1 Tax=Solitalea lacus TaxID=2911172 RepID=UPI001EDABE0E|nr:thiamine phosphate synthase [Solitalea lacus]UKJ06873.1 thiamine phosphate synthase [Solitalea lacus]
MQIASLQYISQGATPAEHLQNIQKSLNAGCRWIQLRLKNYDDNVILSSALQALQVCKAANAVLIINDRPDIAKAIGAHGVHLGKKDSSPLDVREALGSDFIIGGTANTIDDIRALSGMGVNYIGLGPYRFTTTKQNLSPLLGLQGYQAILKQMKTEALELPVIAIGGLTIDDVEGLKEAGVYGVAVSSVITHAEDACVMVQEFENKISSTSQLI